MAAKHISTMKPVPMQAQAMGIGPLIERRHAARDNTAIIAYYKSERCAFATVGELDDWLSGRQKKKQPVRSRKSIRPDGK